MDYLLFSGEWSWPLSSRPKRRRINLREVVQVDSVISTVGRKCLLTIHFAEPSLMLAFLRDANTSQSVIDIFSALDKILGP